MSVRIGIGEGTASRLWELEALSRLDDAARHCARAGDDFEACLGTILDAAIFVTAADKGDLQLLEPLSGCLVIRAQRGFGQPFLDFFSYVDQRADVICAAMLRKPQGLVIEEVAGNEMFSGTDAGEVLLSAGVHALQATPLASRAGRVVGVLSTHFTQRTRLGEQELGLMRVLARQAADYVERKQMDARFSR